MPLPFPNSLEEQRRIVAILDEAHDGLARARANVEANLDDTKDVLRTILEYEFSIDDGWPKRTLDQIAENLDSLRVPVTKRDRQPGNVPYYGASGAVDKVANYLFDEDLLLVSEDGANLLMRNYPIAFSISGKAWVNNHAHVLRFSERVTQTFVEIYLNSISLAPYVSGMAQPKLNQRSLNSIPIPFPDIKERKRIVKVFQIAQADAERLQTHYQTSLSDLATAKQSILAKAFRGELT